MSTTTTASMAAQTQRKIRRNSDLTAPYPLSPNPYPLIPT